MVNDNVSCGAEEGSNTRSFAEKDLKLGKKAIRVFGICSLVAIFICIGIAIFVFTNVPWDTRMPYDGKYNRSGSGIPMQIAMLPILVLLFGLWRSGQKLDSYKMHSGSRIGIYILGTGVILGCVLGQWTIDQSILTAGGYFGN